MFLLPLLVALRLSDASIVLMGLVSGAAALVMMGLVTQTWIMFLGKWGWGRVGRVCVFGGGHVRG